MCFDVVMAMTGFDPIAGLRSYHDERSAIRLFARTEFKTVVGLVEAKFTEIPPHQRTYGDLGYPADIPHPLMSPAVIFGEFAFGKSPDGMLKLKTTDLARFFAV